MHDCSEFIKKLGLFAIFMSWDLFYLQNWIESLFYNETDVRLLMV